MGDGPGFFEGLFFGGKKKLKPMNELVQNAQQQLTTEKTAILPTPGKTLGQTEAEQHPVSSDYQPNPPQKRQTWSEKTRADMEAQRTGQSY